MRNSENTVFVVGARVVRKNFSRWGNDLLSVQRGKVAKRYKNGNFVIQWDGQDKADPQQYGAYGCNDRASATGGGWGDRASPVEIETPESEAKIAALQSLVKWRKRLQAVQERIAALKPNNYGTDDLVELEGLVKALEKTLPPQQQKESK